jgi:hypothetical protein
MAHLLNHHIKEFLTIIVKITLSVLILTHLSCNKMDKHNFKVFGEESLLKDCKINVYKSSENLQRTETLLFKGNQYEVKSSESDIRYIVYVSYKDSLVNTIDYENIMGGEENQINHFYIQKNKDVIVVKFVGLEELLQEVEDRPIDVLIPVDEFFGKKKINSEELKNKEKKLFFDFYGK